ncbi:peptidase, M19 family [Cystobacter fuscus DSM 2262]|uniref:Peptidase, M19 family n=1 Tax=Cystobacter fuscus (strain ATCC 25194 / DSM 2262 / NBRC 100088 / M29) TaxID=1242864 RepID=S9P6S7_CYSF2|nr:membrane dipeptidase [Cystobacter fuscus]EPX58886.1 peptidase, M19 family [Cystobacter fuscus DSM 2262]
MEFPLRSRTLISLSLALTLAQGCGPVEQEPEIEPAATATRGLGVSGFAELHHHMFAEEAFGGGWFHGEHTGALTRCDGGWPESDHARVRMDLSNLLNLCPNSSSVDLSGVPVLSQLFGVAGAVGSEFIGKIEGTEGDTGLHDGRRDVGTEWPRWDTIAHQQAWEGWLKQAHERGMSLVTVSLVSNGFLCSVLPTQNLKRPCDEMADIDVQLQMARAFDARTDWAEIALSPAHARQIIASGKLAMVLSIETSKLFGTKDWRTELDRVYALGVRSIQPVHQLDNRFGGAALHNAIFQAAQFIENCHIDTDCGVTTNSFTLGFDVARDAAGNCRNTKGLTDEGKALVQAMMAKGMLVDMAHLSEKSVQDTFAVAQANTYYPLYISHGHFREVMNPDLADDEKTTPATVVRYLRQTGGMFGLRTAHDETRTYTKSGVANDCHGSSRSVAQAYEFGRQGLKVPMAFGADFNGFIQQTRPRFGPHGACSATFEAEADAQAALQQQSGPGRLGTDFDEYGLAHVGLLPDLLTDMGRVGAHTEELANSAETFIRMWERANGPRTGMADAANDIDTSGVAPYEDRAVREQRYKKVDGASCSGDGQCQSGSCGGCADLVGWCFTPNSKTYGDTCKSDKECSTGRCGADCYVNPTGTCLCDSDSHCGSGQYCGWGLNSGKCQNKKSRGSVCSADRECQSGTCRITFTCK